MRHYLLIFMFFSSLLSLSFADIKAQEIDKILEALEQSQISTEDAENILQKIETNKDNPNKIYNLNKIGREEMLILGLNNFQIFCLENYILRTGELLSINELKFVNGFDSVTINRLLPYVYVAPKNEKHSLRLDSIFLHSKQTLRGQYVHNLRTPYGYLRTDNKGFQGENFSSSLRYNLSYYDRLEFSLVAEKDYGEPFYYKNKTYGFDHYSSSLTLRDLGKHVKQLTLGDYRLNIGEGLAMKQSFSLGYLSFDYGIKHSNNTIAPFRSVSEYNYNRGIALKTEWNNLEISLFGSYKGIDFNGKSIQETGYHRTETEIKNKNANSIALYGTTIQYYNKGLNIGLTAFAYHFDKAIVKGTQKYQAYNFEGKNNNILSLNSSYTYKSLIFFAEIAKSQNNAFAELIGMQWNISYKHNLSVLVRNYDKEYQNHYASAVGYHSHNANEQGLYLNYSRYINKNLSLFLGGDLYYFPYASYRADEPSHGYKIKSQIDYNPTENQTLNFYFRINSHGYNTLIDSVKQIKPSTICQYQAKYSILLNDHLSLATKVGYSHSYTYKDNSNYGYFAYLEGVYQSLDSRHSLRLRYTYFNTSDYDNRFYVYEYSLPLMFSSSLLYQTGHKLYVILSSKLAKNFKAYLRYNLTRYNHTTEISSGNSLVKGNLLHYLGGQICYEF